MVKTADAGDQIKIAGVVRQKIHEVGLLQGDPAKPDPIEVCAGLRQHLRTVIYANGLAKSRRVAQQHLPCAATQIEHA